MTNSMKDLLLGLGFKATPRSEKAASTPPQPPRKSRAAGEASPSRTDARSAPRHARSSQGRHRHAEMDLGKAYALRAQQEKDERIEVERARQEAARIKREAKARVVGMLAGRALNDAAAEVARHFEYNGKIRRVHVTPEQLRALNAGLLGVVQLDGRYLLVEATLADQVHELLPSLVALRVDPHAPVGEDPYADPKYAIPDDIVW